MQASQRSSKASPPMADRSSLRRLLALGVGAAVLGAAGLGATGAAQAQSTGTGSSTMSGYRTGYGMSSSEFSNPVNVATTDSNGNHIYVDGVSQNGASGSIFNRNAHSIFVFTYRARQVASAIYQLENVFK